MVNWNDKDVVEWEKVACHEQAMFCSMLGDRRWDLIKPNENLILRRKIGYGLFGKPTRNPDPNNTNDIGYTSDQDTEIETIYQLILEEGRQHDNRGHTWFACIFICCKMYDDRFTFPVFRILKDSTKDISSTNNCTFIDHIARVYASWDDYLHTNKLPKCLVMYPRNGIYQTKETGEVDCDKSVSNACLLEAGLVSVLDVAATVAGVGASIVGLVSLCAVPIAGPVLAASFGAGLVAGSYGFFRSSEVLIDRYRHKQSIGLDSSESRSCWLTIVTTPLFFGQFGLLFNMQNAAQLGLVMSRAVRVSYSVMNVANIGAGFLSIIQSAVVIAHDLEHGTLTVLDIYQFTATCIFMGHSSMNAKTASTIIKNFQQEHIDTFKTHLTNEHAKKDFDSIIKKIQGENKMRNTAKLIRELNHIENGEDFINSLVEVEQKHNIQRGDISISGGLVNLMDEWLIHPKKLSQVDVNSVIDIIDATKKFKMGDIDLQMFKSNLSKISSKYRIYSESLRADTINKLQKHFNVTDLKSVKINKVAIFKDLPGPDIDRLRNVLENTAKNYNPDIIDMAMKFADAQGCKNAREFCNYLEYSVKYTNDMKNQYLADYKRNPGAYGKFTGKQKQYFEKKVYEDIMSDSTKFNEMCTEFNKTKSEVSEANATASLKFNSDTAATYHYVKHRGDFKINTTEMTPKEYLDLAKDIVTAQETQKSIMLSQEGDVTFITFDGPNGVKVIAVKPRDRGESCHLATCYRV